MIILTLTTMSKIYIFLFLSSFLFAQDGSMNRQDRKYCSNFFLAEKYKMLDDHDKALKKYLECTEIYPDESSAYFEAAKILFNNLNYDEAKEYAIRAAEIDPNNRWYLFFLTQLFRSQYDFEREAETWEKLILIDPTNIVYYFDCTIAYLELGNFKKALKTLNNYEKKVGNNEDIILLKSKIYKDQGDKKKQVRSLQKGIDDLPKPILLLEELAKFYIQESLYDLAHQTYEKIVKIDPSNSTALLASYTILNNKNKRDDSKKLLKKIIENTNISEQKKQEIIYNIMISEEELNFYYNDISILLESCVSLYPNSSFFIQY